MTYVAQETSIEGGAPVELFEFDLGSSIRFYTSSDADVTPGGGQTYTAVSIQRGDTSDGTTSRESETQVVLPTSDVVSQLYTAKLPGVRLGLKILRYHRTDTAEEVVELFDGLCISGSFRKNASECVISARTSVGGAGKILPRRTYRSLCNHTLYDAICQVDDTNPSFRASNISVTGSALNVLTVTGIGAFDPGWFTGGYVKSLDGTGDQRLILNHTGNDLTLLSQFFIIPPTVNIFAGCDHSSVVCAVKFLNYARFGGFISVPLKDPFRRLV